MTNAAMKRFYSSSSSGASANDSPATSSAATTPDSQSGRESEYDTNEPAPGTAFNAAQVSSKLTNLAANANATNGDSPAVPGADEGHPIDPLLRVYDPTKDSRLTIDELLARPRRPRTPYERSTMRKFKARMETAAKGGDRGELAPEQEAAAQKLVEKTKDLLRKSEREKAKGLILDMAYDLDFYLAAIKKL